jgi:hypothetical protein
MDDRSGLDAELLGVWPGPAMKLVGPLAVRSPGLRLALAVERKGRGGRERNPLLFAERA